MRYVALLRGINVGGKSIIRMAKHMTVRNLNTTLKLRELLAG